MLVSHFNSIKRTNIDTYSTEDAAVKVNFKFLNNLSSMAFTRFRVWVVVHLSAHTLRRTLSYTNHAPSAKGFFCSIIP